MNERIRDLKEQALCWAVETLDPDALNDNEWGVAIDEKFAELIVRECAEIVRIQNEQFMENESHYGVVSTDILKHFGVEE